MSSESVDVNVNIRRPVSTFWIVLPILFILTYWKVTLVIVGAVCAAYLLFCLVRAIRRDLRVQRELIENHRAEMRRRADEENTLFHAGDPRGLYGLDYDDGQEQRS